MSPKKDAEVEILISSRSGFLQQGESVIFNTNVKTSPLHRRASRVVAIAVPPIRKTRELVLTDRRLVSIKPKFRRHTFRYELSLKPPQENYHLTEG